METYIDTLQNMHTVATANSISTLQAEFYFMELKTLLLIIFTAFVSHTKMLFCQSSQMEFSTEMLQVGKYMIFEHQDGAIDSCIISGSEIVNGYLYYHSETYFQVPNLANASHQLLRSDSAGGYQLDPSSGKEVISFRKNLHEKFKWMGYQCETIAHLEEYEVGDLAFKNVILIRRDLFDDNGDHLPTLTAYASGVGWVCDENRLGFARLIRYGKVEEQR